MLLTIRIRRGVDRSRGTIYVRPEPSYCTAQNYWVVRAFPAASRVYEGFEIGSKMSANVPSEEEIMESQVVCQAHKQLSRNGILCSCSDSISIEYHKGNLVLMGRLPSFYLKQVLQTALRGLPGVQQIENRVNVVSPTGLSSTK